MTKYAVTFKFCILGGRNPACFYNNIMTVIIYNALKLIVMTRDTYYHNIIMYGINLYYNNLLGPY